MTVLSLPLLIFGSVVTILVMDILRRSFKWTSGLFSLFHGTLEDDNGIFASLQHHAGDRSQKCNKTESEIIDHATDSLKVVPLSVNYHFTRQCNYKCGFCFHTAKNSYVLPIEEAKRGLRLLKDEVTILVMDILRRSFKWTSGLFSLFHGTLEDDNGIFAGDRSQKCNKTESEIIDHATDSLKVVPLSVNYHFTRQCNYKCGFCFHTAKNSYVLPIEEAKRGLRLLKEEGMQKVNFSGGEPFLQDRGRFVGELVKFCKSELHLPSVTIVSNGSLITEKWFQKYGEHLDILAISCDSFDPETNALIGRQQGKRNHIDSLKKVRNWCLDYKVAFKLNTVVNTHNKNEDMTENIMLLDPCRWKVFQCLLLEGENAGEDALRNAKSFVISNEEFHQFLDRHEQIKCLVPESNEKMQNSYLILDECMRFLDCRDGKKIPSKSLLDVGVEHALQYSGFDEGMFLKRGGKYVWSKADMNLEW